MFQEQYLQCPSDLEVDPAKITAVMMLELIQETTCTFCIPHLALHRVSLGRLGPDHVVPV